MALRLKMNETRGWYTAYRGPLAIHATRTDNEEIRAFWESPACDPIRVAGYDRFENLPRGAVLCTTNLCECLRTTDAIVSARERSFGNYAPGRFAWVCTDTITLPKPVPFRGAQGFWNWPADSDEQTLELFL